MDKSYTKLFSLIGEKHAPSHLFEQTSYKIRVAQISRARTRTGLFGIISLVTLIALIPAISYLSQSLSQSNMSQYISLIISDGSSIMLYWKELAFSIINSLPLTGVIIVLAIVLLMSYSLKRVIQYFYSLQNIIKQSARFARAV